MKEIMLKEVCERLNVSRRQVQGYEKEGLVSPTSKNKYGYLLYDEGAIERIEFIKKHQDYGFTVKEIKQLFDMNEEQYIEKLNVKLTELKIKLCKMKSIVDELEYLITDKQ